MEKAAAARGARNPERARSEPGRIGISDLSNGFSKPILACPERASRGEPRPPIIETPLPRVPRK
ncbi:MAG TPA: hypothetical protein VEZ40_08145 [Pyrinomonadaceae bacterium]|nr:hypothetical protein [Pyrinomonadaceae bacterium]